METKYWRIRHKNRLDNNVGELNRSIWGRDEVGIWYGAFSAKDLKVAMQKPEVERLPYLAKIHSKLIQDWDLTRGYFQTAKRFADISKTDWVFTCFDNAIHLARVCSSVLSSAEHPHNLSNGQIFKYRKISQKKSFALDDLNDAYRLIPSAGQSNVHELRGTSELIRLLARSKNTVEVVAAFNRMSLYELLDMLGPSGWD